MNRGDLLRKTMFIASLTASVMVGAESTFADAVVLTSGTSSADLGQGASATDPFMDSLITDGIDAFQPGVTNGQSFYLNGTVALVGGGTSPLFESSGDLERIQPSTNGGAPDFTLDNTLTNPPNNAVYGYTAGPLSINADYTLVETTPGIVTLTEQFTISWDPDASPESASFSFIIYTNPDLDGDGPGDSATYFSQEFTQTDGDASFVVQVDSSGFASDAERAEINTPAGLLSDLDDPSTATVLSSSSAAFITTTSPIDAAFAYQFSFVEFGPNSGPIVIDVTKTFTTGTAAPLVPEPTSLGLLAAAGTLLLGGARRQRRRRV